jgi:hypothetical protein
VTDDEDVDDASLRSMRTVWLAMRDEEPPVAGMAELLAAARAHAEASHARPSWASRALSSLRRPPALAFATVVVLVGGVLLSHRAAPVDQDRAVVSQATRAPAPGSSAPAAVAPSSPMSATINGVGAAVSSDRDDRGDRGGRGVARGAPAPPGDPQATRPGRRASSVTSPARGAAPSSASEATPEDAPESAAETASATESGRRADLRDQAGASGVADPRATPTKPVPAALAAEPDDGRRADLRDQAGASGVADPRATPTKPVPAALAALVKQAVDAAARGDCQAARATVARIKQQDASYAARVANTAALVKCR